MNGCTIHDIFFEAVVDRNISIVINKLYRIVGVSKKTICENLVDIPTTKPNAQLHGFGLENVKTLLHKYNGEYAMEYDEGWFTFTGEIDNYPIL